MNERVQGVAPARPAAPGAPAPNRWIEAARWSGVALAATVMVSPPLANLAMALMLAGLLASGEAGPRLRTAMRQPLCRGALLVLVVVAVGMLWAQVPWSERLQAFWSWRKLMLIPFLLALFGPARWKRRLAAAYLASCALALAASFAIVIVTGHVPTGPEQLAGALLRNHSAQSLAFAVAVLVALWFAMEPGAAPRARRGLVALAGLFVLNMAFVTPGRSGLLALVPMLVVLGLSSLRGWRAAGALLGMGAFFAVALALSPLARDGVDSALREWREVATAKEISRVGIRVTFYENTLEIVRERPLLGVGTGGFGAAYRAHIAPKYPASDWRATPTGDPHNQYLFFVAEVGLVGLAAFLAFIGLALGDRGDGTRARILAVAILCGWCVTSLFSSHFKTFAEGHLLAVFLGAMLARGLPGENGARVPRQPSQR